MAYVSNMNDDEGQQQQPASQGPISPGGTGQTVHLAPSGGVGSAGGSPGAAPKPGAGGQFATLQNYVDANQGQAAPLANNITSGINQQYNTLQGQNQSTLSGIQNEVNGAYTPQDQGVLSQEAANPVSFASNPSNIASFQKQLNDQYTGPGSAEGDTNYQNQFSADTQAATTANNLNSSAGLQQTLQNTEKVPTASVTGLNQAILSQDPNALGSISAAYQPFQGLTSQLSSGAGNIDQSIAQNQAQAQGASNAANAQIAQQENGLQSNLNNELSNGVTQAQNYQNELNNYYSGANGANTDITNFENNINNATLGQVNPGAGFSPGTANANADLLQNAAYGQGANTWNNIGMGATLTPPQVTAAPPTLAQVATPDQFSEANALSQLAGPSYTNPLSGLTPTAYNPQTSGMTLQQMLAPETNPLNTFVQGYVNSGGGGGPGGAVNANYVNSQYQNLMNQLNQLYSAEPTWGPTPTPQLPTSTQGSGPLSAR